MGAVAGAHGVRGLLRIKPFSRTPDALLAQPRWLFADGENWREIAVVKAQMHGAFILAQIIGCDSREDAEKMSGCAIAIPRRLLPPLPDGEYYWADLVGMSVVRPDGEALGAVAHLFTAGGDVLCVRGENGETLIPFADSYIKTVDPAARKIVADWSGEYQ